MTSIQLYFGIAVLFMLVLTVVMPKRRFEGAPIIIVALLLGISWLFAVRADLSPLSVGDIPVGLLFDVLIFMTILLSNIYYRMRWKTLAVIANFTSMMLTVVYLSTQPQEPIIQWWFALSNNLLYGLQILCICWGAIEFQLARKMGWKRPYVSHYRKDNGTEGRDQDYFGRASARRKPNRSNG